MKRILLALVLPLFIATFFVFPKLAKASEGEVFLTNTVNEQARCWVSSVLMPNQNYKLIFSCRDITYPGGVEVFNYVFWINPTTGGGAQRLGTLGLGKGEFQTKTAFGSVFVTKERNENTRSPEGPVVMQGTLKTVEHLEKRSPGQGSGGQGGSFETISPTASPIVTPQPRTGIAKVVTGGIITIVGIAAILFLIFVVLKK